MDRTTEAPSPTASTTNSRHLQEAAKFANCDEPILIRGETGTGKSYLARFIHDQSHRKTKPFKTVNLAGLDDTLASTELFGSVKGAFSDATEKPGAFELAGDGTIFLDEVGDCSAAVQLKLLHVLEGGVFHRVGDVAKEKRSRARVIAATNRDLRVAVRNGKFREDLYYRLCCLSIRVPPLRERRGEVEGLARQFFTQKLSDASMSSVREYARALDQRFAAHDWPGNIRDLQHAVANACVELRSGADVRSATDRAYDALLATRLDTPEKGALHQALVTFIADYFRAYISGQPDMMTALSPRIIAAIVDAIRLVTNDVGFHMPSTPTALGRLLGTHVLAAGKIGSQALPSDYVRYREVGALVELASDPTIHLPDAVRRALRDAA